MRTPWTPWLLGGALIASLQWNLRSVQPAQPVDGPSACALRAESAPAFDFDAEQLALTDAQKSQLETRCGMACSDAAAIERSIEAQMHALRTALSAPEIDREHVDALVADITSQRRAFLEMCVESVVAVREVLSAEQVSTLLEECCPTSSPECSTDTE